MEDCLLLPDNETIETWKTINDVKFVETSPRSVPLATFIRYPAQGYVDEVISVKTNIPAAKHIAFVKAVQEDIAATESYLYDIYSKRSIVSPLSKKREDGKDDNDDGEVMKRIKESGETGRAIAESLFTPLYQYVSGLKEKVEEIYGNITHMFMNENLFVNGQWSDYLLDSFCLLIYRFTALQKIASSKEAISNDLSQLMLLSQTGGSQGPINTQLVTIKMWIASPESITDNLVKKLTDDVTAERVLVIFKIFYKYIRGKLENRNFIIPEQRYHYVVMLKFIFKWYQSAVLKEERDKPNVKKSKRVLQPLKDDYIMFLKATIDTYKLIPLIYDCTIETKEKMDESIFNIKKPNIKNPANFPKLGARELAAKAQDYYNKLSSIISEMSNAQKQKDKYKLELDDSKFSEKIVEFLPDVLKNMSMIMSVVRQLIIKKQLSPPVPENEEQKKLCSYELSMRYGMDDSTLTALLALLWIARSTRELLSNNITLISQAISDATQKYLQNYAINLLPQAVLRNQEHKALITDVIESCRLLLGYYDSDTNFSITAKKVSKLPTIKPNINVGVPALYIIQLIRAQMQLLTNKDAPAVSKQGLFTGQPLDSDDEKMFKNFIEHTAYFENLIDLETSLERICDQSQFFFKEYYMSMNHRTFFPVSTSIPVILSKFALEHYKIISLSGAIFYPLSIYDDAASAALRVLKSRMLYNEIKAEASICIQYISREIAEKAFLPIMKFATLRMTEPEILKQFSAIDKDETIQEDISSLRLGVILQQNMLTILGKTIDTKTLISQRINEIFKEKMDAIMSIVEKYGLISMHVVTRLIEALKKAHKLFTTFNLNLMAFDDLVRISFALDNPASFQSRLLTSIAFNLIDTVISDYSILTFPLRIIPKSPLNIADDIMKVFKDLTGKLLSYVLAPTASFISVETIKEFFWNLDDGAIMIFHQQLVNVIPELIEAFIEIYKACPAKLKRIQNPPSSVTCYQAFDRFEGAYHYFIDSAECRCCLSLMTQIGNILLISQMMDNAFILKRTTEAQVSSFMFSESPLAPEDTQRVPELFEIYDKPFQATFQYFNLMAKKIQPTEVNMPMLCAATKALVNSLLPNYQLFAESSSNLFDIQSLTGFASIYSVLEFISSNIIVLPSSEGGGVLQYGEGIYFFAAALLLLTKQRRLFRALSIGEKIISHMITDFSEINDIRIDKFISASRFASSALAHGFGTLQSIMDSLIEH